jgi:exopolyphosphatase / guanosine-5'-triphosphate,3'-diphosphate pyrophosphatase
VTIIACGMDIGSNSFRLLVAKLRNGLLHPLVHDLVTVRLGEGLGASGLLGSAAMIRAEAALARFAGKARAYRPHSVRACATHALRQAANSRDFLRRAEARTGIRIEVLSGEEEARLALLGALSALPDDRLRFPLVLVDVGGGSTEIICRAAAEIEPLAISVPLGSVGLTEEFGSDHGAMAEKIRSVLAPVLGASAHGESGRNPVQLVAAGGTATSLAALALGLKCHDGQRIRNYSLSQGTLRPLLARLAGLSPEKRNGLPGLANGRGEIILAGALILQALQLALGGADLLVSDAGLLEGILLDGANGLLNQGTECFRMHSRKTGH